MGTLHGAGEGFNTQELRDLIENFVDVTAWHGAYGDAICPYGHTDARVYLDGVPRLACNLHERCKADVAAANDSLRDAFFTAFGGQNFTVELTPEDKEALAHWKRMKSLTATARLSLAAKIIKDVPVESWMQESPFKLSKWNIKNSWAPFLAGLFAPEDLLWIGDLCQSGREFKYCFRTTEEWLCEMDIPPGPQLCAAPFGANEREFQDHLDFRVIPQDEDTGEYDLRGVRDFWQLKGRTHFVGVYRIEGTFRRAAKYLRERPYIVLESDTLTREQFGSVVNYLRKFALLRSLVDTAGKGIHALFERPNMPYIKLCELYAILEGLGADPKTLKRACPTTRLPGYERVDAEFNRMGIQRLLYLNPKYLI